VNGQRVRAIARKEVWHLLRDPRSLALILLMPSLLLFLFGYAIRLDLYEAPIAIIQQSRDAATEELVARFAASRAFNVVLRSNDRREAAAALQKGQVWAALIFPPITPGNWSAATPGCNYCWTGWTLIPPGCCVITPWRW
jgi:ABC-2 type transport system permease protein